MKQRRKIHPFLLAPLATATAFLVLPAALAFANSNHERHNCDLGVNLEAHAYPDTPPGASGSVTVEYDGQVTFQQVFGPTLKANAPNPDKTRPHLVRVTFDRFDYVGPDGDREIVFTLDACAPPTTPAPTTTPSTTTTTGPHLPCVTDADGHSNFQGTNTPCTPDATTTTTQPPTPSTPNDDRPLPVTGLDLSAPIAGVAITVILLGALVIWSARLRKAGRR